MEKSTWVRVTKVNLRSRKGAYEMTVIDKIITEKRTGSESEEYHINNMVGARLRISEKNNEKRVKESCNDGVLSRLKSGKKTNRILLDLLAVSVTPKRAERNWRMIDTKEENSVMLMKRGMFDFKPNGKITELGVDEFFEFFKKEFEGILDISEKYEEFGGGGVGFNDGRVYTLGESSAKINFRFFNPDKAEFDDGHYKSGSRFDNYLRQKINIKLTGDGLQYLRSQGNLVKYILKLYELFPSDATMFDVALDLFNYNQIPRYYFKQHEKKRYLSRSTLNIFGDADNMTVYIGEFKGARTIMMYDKLQESRDSEKSDEPELVKVLEETEGDWFRLEQHFSNNRREAEQAFGYIVYTMLQEREPGDDLDRRFIDLLSAFLRKSVEEKCRFLSEPRKERNNIRIKTDKKWDEILNAIETVDIDFAFMRPEVTLEQRMKNFKYKSIGGNQFHLDVIEGLGEVGYMEFMMEVGRHHLERAEESREKTTDRGSFTYGES